LILVVDDDHAIRESLSELLEDEGYHVAKATNGQEALEVLARVGPPCVILLDLMMPVMDGYEFMGRKTADPALASIPVVVITAAGVARIQGVIEGIIDGMVPEIEDVAQGSDARIPVVLPKPVRADTLISAVRRFC
jgi:CheY-like chemotaxis protein